jgi:hypothetical protein
VIVENLNAEKVFEEVRSNSNGISLSSKIIIMSCKAQTLSGCWHQKSNSSSHSSQRSPIFHKPIESFGNSGKTLSVICLLP